MDKHSYLGNIDIAQLDSLYRDYVQNPQSVDYGWRKFFEGYEFSHTDFKTEAGDTGMLPAEFKVIGLINAYRERGHLFTLTNPVRTRRKYSPTLDYENFGLNEADLSMTFEAGKELGLGPATLRDIIERLRKTYCQSVGIEFMYIRRVEIVEWLKNKMESSCNTPEFSIEEKKTILQKLSEAVLFEKFIHKKFTGQKRFSLEGVESLIPALDAVIEKAAELGDDEFVIGMPHRGRLNVLANILRKSYRDIFSEFEGKEFEDNLMMGDVKYHMGFTSERQTKSGRKIRLSLSPNPSHLETVNPVVLGIARARYDRSQQQGKTSIVPILIHGDAAIAGQGIVYEVVQMSELPAYHTGGTIHLVVNNQVGFTTNYIDGRSSIYCTDVAKIIQSPIFHVNADDVEAVVYTIRLAMEFRDKFHKDVFIDLLGYRKYGHNESDEPRFTQPTLYKIIERHPDPREVYLRKLLAQGAIEESEAAGIEQQFNELLEADLLEARSQEKVRLTSFLEKEWKGIRRAVAEDFSASPPTGVRRELLEEIGRKIAAIPPGKKFFRKTEKLQAERLEMIEKGEKLDWAMCELLSYGCLLSEQVPVRISGQDVQRGTFSHRHAVITLEDTEEYYIPLANLSAGAARFEIYNSLLSEYGVLGFEYGYSIADPKSLTIWEAQFGDFSNGAQIIFDQYISSAEEKWKVMSGLVVLLPHGYEGQGPEHSSARMERFLTLCADGNMQVVNCSTPANFFHVIRRQVHREIRKPLVVLTPKSLLRHPACVSSLGELSSGRFMEVLDDSAADPEKITRVVFCTGKIYYELIDEREKTNAINTALIRLEQLYPFPLGMIREVIKKYNKADKYIWVQEEPANMGAWPFILRQFKEVELLLIARPESGSTAVGSSRLHAQRQRKIIEKAFGECQCGRVQDVCRMLCAPKEWVYIGTAKE